MSQWKLIARTLYEADKPCRAIEIDQKLGYSAGNNVGAGLARGQELGILHKEGMYADAHWSLTEKGEQWCLNRIEIYRQFAQKYKFVLTWLNSLPMDIKLNDKKICNFSRSSSQQE